MYQFRSERHVPRQPARVVAHNPNGIVSVGEFELRFFCTAKCEHGYAAGIYRVFHNGRQLPVSVSHTLEDGEIWVTPWKDGKPADKAGSRQCVPATLAATIAHFVS